MKKSEMFDILVEKVCDVCEIDYDKLVQGSRIQSVVDARILLVQYLKRIGLSSDEISEIVIRRKESREPSIKDIKIKSRGIDKIFSSYSQRCLESYSFCLMSIEIKEFCRTKYEEIYLKGMKQLPTK